MEDSALWKSGEGGSLTMSGAALAVVLSCTRLAYIIHVLNATRRRRWRDLLSVLCAICMGVLIYPS